MIGRRPPPVRRRDVDRLRTLSAGVMGSVPGSVPVSASGNGASVPSSTPVVPYDPIRSPTQSDFPTAVGGSHPVFSWPGPVTAPDLGPPWPCTAAATYTEFVIVQADGDDVLDIDVLVNGSVVDTVTTTATRKQTLSISVSVVDGDDIQLDLTDEGGGDAINLGVVLR